MKKAIDELAQVRRDRGASYFWVTETKARSARFALWLLDGILIRRKDDPDDQFPWMVFDVKDSAEDLISEIRDETILQKNGSSRC